MLEIVKQTIAFYLKNQRAPAIENLNLGDEKALLNEKGSFFVTIYLKGEVRGSAGNIREIKDNAVLELIENTVSAISKDSRFPPLGLNDSTVTKIRVDKISTREVLKDKKLKDLDPAVSGVIAIKKDYTKFAVVLPNINPKLFAGEDFSSVLAEKLGEKKFVETDYIIYEIKTEVETDY